MKANVWTKPGRRRIWQTAALLIPLALAPLACSQGESQPRKASKGQPAIRIAVSHTRRITIQRQVELAGTLISPDQAKVSSEVSGVVREVIVELGDEVKPGSVLARLEPRELEIALRRAQSQLQQTEAQLGIYGSGSSEPLPDDQISAVRTASANRDDARAQAERATRLFQKGLLSQADYDTAHTRLKVTEAALQAALETVQAMKATLHDRRAAVELAQKKLNDAVIRAPIGGSVSERLVQPGEFIRENTPVVTIVQMNPLKLKTAIQEKYAAMMHPGLSAQFMVESVPDEVFPGRLAYISPAVDQSTRTFSVEILVNNSDRRLKPGFFAKGIIHTRSDDNVLAVPEAAVSTLAGESSVFVVEEDKVRKQTVTLGARVKDNIEILSGLEGNEMLATTNLNELADGVSVAVAGADTDASEAGAEDIPANPGRGGRQ